MGHSTFRWCGSLISCRSGPFALFGGELLSPQRHCFACVVLFCMLLSKELEEGLS